MKNSSQDNPKIYKNFWPEPVLSFLNQYTKAFFENNLPCKLQYNYWHSGVVKDSGPVLVYQFEEHEKEPMKKELKKLCNGKDFNNFYCNLHFWQRGSYIPWHADEGYEFTTTTYLNDTEWDKDWGGALLYNDKDKNIYAQFPEYNTIVVQDKLSNKENRQGHGTTILSPSAPTRVSLQTFWS